MKVFMTGGTGFIGQYLARMLLENNYSVVIATRHPEHHTTMSNAQDSGEPDHGRQGTIRYVRLRENMSEDLEGCHVVINLAGESLFGKRWNSSVKKRLYNSRIQTTKSLVAGMQTLDRKPELFLSGSGINYYGNCGNEIVTEERGSGDDFLATLCRDWESAAGEARTSGIRVVTSRTGVVLGTDGGALPIMLPVFKAFLGGALGTGRQYFPWIHIQDFCRAVLYVIRHDGIEGAYNATAPNPTTMNEFSESLGKTLSRTSFFRVPEWTLKLALGEASIPLISSLRTVPETLQKHSFEFQFPEIRQALEDLL